MRKLILSMMVSLDGLTARPDGDLAWFRTDEQFEADMLALLRGVDALLFGRVSYQSLSEYWPTAGTDATGEAPGGFTSKEREIEFARLLNALPKVVFSRTLTETAWKPARIVSDDAAGEVARMKREAGKDLVVFAGAGLATSFMNDDLVDEYHLLVHPIVLGRGLPLFSRVQAERPLVLESARSLPSGVVSLRYRRDRGA
jgi:dihydrofolate reductase